MRKVLNYIIFILVMLVLSNISFSKNYRNKNIIVRETKVLTLKKNYKGNIMYILKKGRYRIRILPNTVDFIDAYIVGNSTEINPDIEGQLSVYEVDTNKPIEIFRQEYKVNKSTKIQIQIEKIEWILRIETN